MICCTSCFLQWRRLDVDLAMPRSWTVDDDPRWSWRWMIARRQHRSDPGCRRHCKMSKRSLQCHYRLRLFIDRLSVHDSPRQRTVELVNVRGMRAWGVGQIPMFGMDSNETTSSSPLSSQPQARIFRLTHLEFHSLLSPRAKTRSNRPGSSPSFVLHSRYCVMAFRR